jgi:hypothetical protein
MESPRSIRVLVVANRTAATPLLLEAVRRRANDGPCEFALLIPDVTDRKAADWTLETALRLMQQPARGKVEGLVGGRDPFESVQDAVRQGNFDEIMISTLPRRASKWLRRDLIRRVEGLGLPVTAIVPGAGKPSRDEERMRQAGAGVGGIGLP